MPMREPEPYFHEDYDRGGHQRYLEQGYPAPDRRNPYHDPYHHQEPVSGGYPAQRPQAGVQYHRYGQQNFAGFESPGALGRAINKQVLETMRDQVFNLQRLDNIIKAYVDQMDSVNLATLLFHSAKKKVVLKPFQVAAVAARLMTLKEELKPREASNALYGLKGFSSDLPETRQLIAALTIKIAATCTDFGAQGIANALYGLQSTTSDHEEVRALLLVIATKVQICTQQLDQQHISNSLYGLRGMNSDHAEVRLLINALIPKVSNCKEELTGQSIGNSLYGLQCMDSDSEEIRGLLVAITNIISPHARDLQAQEISNALYGLRRMSTCYEVSMVIGVLANIIAQTPCLLDAQAVGNCLFGLQSMQAVPEVLYLLSVLALRISASYEVLDGRAMGNALYGLQGLSSEHPEVRAVLGAMENKIYTSPHLMNAQEVSNALYGLKNMSSEHREVCQLMEALAFKVSTASQKLDGQQLACALYGLQGKTSAVKATRMLLAALSERYQPNAAFDQHGMCLAMYALRGMSSECKEVRNMVSILTHKVDLCWKPLTGEQIEQVCWGLQGLSIEEEEVRRLLTALLPKIAASDAMSPQQLANAIFSLQNMSSRHQEVLDVMNAFAIKVSTSEKWNGWQLSQALFGLQGMQCTSQEMAGLLSALIDKLGPLAMSWDMLANAIYGMQRFELSDQVSALLAALQAPMLTLEASIPARVLANMIFGMNGLSAHMLFVRQMLSAIAERMANLQLSANDYTDTLSLYQAAAVSVHSIPDLDRFVVVKSALTDQLTRLQQFLEVNSSLRQAAPLSAIEVSAAQAVTQALIGQPFGFRSGALVYGFEVSMLIKLNPDVVLTTSTGAAFDPKLGLDVIGTSFTFPAKQRYHELRCAYLEEHGVTMRSLSAGCSLTVDVFGPLLPNEKDALAIDMQLSTLAGHPVQYMADVQLADCSAAYADDDLGALRDRGRAMGMQMGWLGDWPSATPPTVSPHRGRGPVSSIPLSVAALQRPGQYGYGQTAPFTMRPRRQYQQHQQQHQQQQPHQYQRPYDNRQQQQRYPRPGMRRQGEEDYAALEMQSNLLLSSFAGLGLSNSKQQHDYSYVDEEMLGGGHPYNMPMP